MKLTVGVFSLPYDQSDDQISKSISDRINPPGGLGLRLARLVLYDHLHRTQEMLLGHAVDGQIILLDAGVIAETEMRSISSHYENVIVDRYVVMPNHVHAIIVIGGVHAYSPVETRLAASPTRGRLPSIVGGYKAGVSRICHAHGLVFAWQARFHDHILRSNASVNAVRDYIDHNPQHWLLDPENPSPAAA